MEDMPLTLSTSSTIKKYKCTLNENWPQETLWSRESLVIFQAQAGLNIGKNLKTKSSLHIVLCLISLPVNVQIVTH